VQKHPRPHREDHPQAPISHVGREQLFEVIILNKADREATYVRLAYSAAPPTLRAEISMSGMDPKCAVESHPVSARLASHDALPAFAPSFPRVCPAPWRPCDVAARPASCWARWAPSTRHLSALSTHSSPPLSPLRLSPLPPPPPRRRVCWAGCLRCCGALLWSSAGPTGCGALIGSFLSESTN